MDKLVSIVVPVYKVEKYLCRCVDSILRQTYSKLEIILVDDGSPDHCGAICDEYRNRDERVRVIHKTNGGLSEARNFGVLEAKGEYVAFVDSDDFIDERYVEVLYRMCEAYKAGISQCGFVRVRDQAVEPFCSPVSQKEVKLYNGLDVLRKLYLPQNIVFDVAWNKLYKRDLFRHALFPIGRIYEDFATIYKLFYEAEKITVTQEPLYYYFMSDNSITRSGFYTKKFDFITTYEERLEFFKNHGQSEIYRNTLYSYYFALIRFYYICRSHGRDLKYKKLELGSKIRKTYQELKKDNQYPLRSKLKIKIAHYLPAVYNYYGTNLRD